MNIVMELALIFGVCLIGIGIAELLPFTVPYSVISLLVLTFLLYRKILKPEQIKDAGGFSSGIWVFFSSRQWWGPWNMWKL